MNHAPDTNSPNSAAEQKADYERLKRGLPTPPTGDAGLGVPEYDRRTLRTTDREPSDLDYRATALSYALQYHDKVKGWGRVAAAGKDKDEVTDQTDVVTTACYFEDYLRGGMEADKYSPAEEGDSPTHLDVTDAMLKFAQGGQFEDGATIHVTLHNGTFKDNVALSAQTHGFSAHQAEGHAPDPEKVQALKEIWPLDAEDDRPTDDGDGVWP